MIALCAKDEARGVIRPTTVLAKGTKESTYPVKWFADLIRDIGYSEIMLMSDGEPAIIDLKNKAKALVAEEGIKVNLEESSVGDWQSKGHIESANGIIEGTLRCWKDRLDTRTRSTAKSSRPATR